MSHLPKEHVLNCLQSIEYSIQGTQYIQTLSKSIQMNIKDPHDDPKGTQNDRKGSPSQANIPRSSPKIAKGNVKVLK